MIKTKKENLYLIISATLIVLTITFYPSLYPKLPPKKIYKQNVSWMGYRNKQALVNSTPNIIIGEVTRVVTSKLNLPGSGKFSSTKFEVKVLDTIKKSPYFDFDTIIVSMFGAENETVMVIFGGNPLLKVGEKLVLFLGGPGTKMTFGFGGPWARYIIKNNRVYSLDVVYPEIVHEGFLGDMRVDGQPLDEYIDTIKNYEYARERAQLVDVSDLELRLQPDKDRYFIGETAQVSLYLVNPRPEYVIVKYVLNYYISGEDEGQSGAFTVIGAFNTSGDPITLGPNKKRLIGTQKMKPWSTGNFTFEARIKSLESRYTVKISPYPYIQLENDTLVHYVIRNARDLAERDSIEHVISENEEGKVNVTIELGEIASGEEARMIEDKEFSGEMTAYVRYFKITRYGVITYPGQIIGERFGWIDMKGRCYIYEGWDLL